MQPLEMGGGVKTKQTGFTLIELMIVVSLLAIIGPIRDGPGGSPMSISDIAIQPGTGTLFAVRSSIDGLNRQGRLYTVDKGTGIATLVGNTNAFTATIAFAPDGTLYESAQQFGSGGPTNPSWRRINPANGNIVSSVNVPEFFGALAVRPSDGALFGTFINQGEVCSAGSRVLVQKDIYRKFVDAAAAKAKHGRVGRAGRALVEQHGDDLAGRSVAEQLAERLLVPGDAVLLDQRYNFQEFADADYVCGSNTSGIDEPMPAASASGFSITGAVSTKTFTSAPDRSGSGCASPSRKGTAPAAVRRIPSIRCDDKRRRPSKDVGPGRVCGMAEPLSRLGLSRGARQVRACANAGIPVALSPGREPTQ